MSEDSSITEFDLLWRVAVDNDEVSELHRVAFNQTELRRHDWSAQISRWSLGWVVARVGTRLLGFLNVPWDGGAHAWLQDVIVHPDWQRQGLGRAMVTLAATQAGASGCDWLHVDFDDDSRDFYLDGCGFRSTPAGLLWVSQE